MPSRRWSGPNVAADVPATRWEILGAWLHLWTPPRDAAIPPVPWPKVAAAAVLLAAAVVAVLLLVVPAIDASKSRQADRTARERAAFVKRERRQLAREQRATITQVKGDGAITPQVEAAIARGTRARLATGELTAPALRSVRCEPQRREPDGRLGLLCTAVTGEIRGTQQGFVGFPFVAVIAADHRSFAWCKANPASGEQEGGRGLNVPLPRVCR